MQLRCVLVALCLVFMTISFAYGAAPLTLTLDGAELQCDEPPYIEQGTTMVPYRIIAEALGTYVSWDGKEKKVSITGYGGEQVTLQIGSTTAVVGDREVPLRVPPRVKNNRTFVPLRFVAESLGCSVKWLPASHTVAVITPDDGSEVFLREAMEAVKTFDTVYFTGTVESLTQIDNGPELNISGRKQEVSGWAQAGGKVYAAIKPLNGEDAEAQVMYLDGDNLFIKKGDTWVKKTSEETSAELPAGSLTGTASLSGEQDIEQVLQVPGVRSRFKSDKSAEEGLVVIEINLNKEQTLELLKRIGDGKDPGEWKKVISLLSSFYDNITISYKFYLDENSKLIKEKDLKVWMYFQDVWTGRSVKDMIAINYRYYDYGKPVVPPSVNQ
ncbi:MAG: copper amine oxidase N-terminal domain-containing protein [Peptococcaceae bacterium]|nr:copper amine oxidase N-terminal domain-containing protein [Peptococcaceae bacterium]